MRTLTLLYKCRTNLKRCSACRWGNWVGVAPGFSTDFCTQMEKQTTAEQHDTVSRYEHTGRLAEKVCSVSLFKSGAIWHTNVPKCREVQIIARHETPPLLLVSCKLAATGTRPRGRGFQAAMHFERIRWVRDALLSFFFYLKKQINNY